jgi:tetratricopeptide (TPR) repeat protein
VSAAPASSKAGARRRDVRVAPRAARWPRLALFLALLAAGCDGDASHAAPEAAVRQSLDEPLRPVLARAGEGDAARALVAEYRRRPGALVYQAEFVLGCTYQQEKNYSAAKEHFERALLLAPTYSPPWHFLGFANYYLGDLPGAHHAFEEHLEHAPDEGESWFGLGITDFDLGRLTEAEQDFRNAIQRNEALRQADPQHRARAREVSKARVRLADVLLAKPDLAGARDQLEQAAKLWPEQVETWFKLSQVRAQLGDAAGAAQAQQTYLDLKARQTPTRGEGS